MTSKKFTKLEKKVEKEYKRKGYGAKKAAYIGRATAGEVARKKKK